MMFVNFQKFIFRSPIFGFAASIGKDLNKIEQEAIFLASPELYKEMVAKENKSDKDKNKLGLSIFKYQLRMRSRCTPFGLFSGCGIGDIDDKSAIILEENKAGITHTRLDMDFLCTLIQSIDAEKEKLIYFPNTSLYKILDLYRYVEYRFEKTRRIYDLTEIESDKYLERVLELCADGCSYSKIIETLNSDERVDQESIKDYVNTLIDSQVLVNNLYPHVTGQDLLQNIINVMNDHGIRPDTQIILKKIKARLAEVDKLKIGRSLSVYHYIEEDIKSLGVAYNRQVLFQTDTRLPSSSPKLSSYVVGLVQEGIGVLNKLMPQIKNKWLSEFIEDHYNRYEEQEVPLVEALDPDIGVGFGNFKAGNIDYHPLIDKVRDIVSKEDDTNDWNKTDLFFLEKYHIAVERKDKVISITAQDVAKFEFDTVNLPPTFSAMFEVVNCDTDTEDPAIILSSVGGSSAANLINRFCHIDKSIENYVKSIIEKENELIGENKIIAEVVHLPESRTGNILFRPSLREYEIPYLATASVVGECRIPITDLLISVTGGKTIKLRSKRLNKEIIPRLTTAHNFTNETLPIYQFLGILQSDNVKMDISFRWNQYMYSKPFLPRVQYKNIILALARWNFEKEAMADSQRLPGSSLKDKLVLFKEKYALPRFVTLVKDDNKLVIDLSNEESGQLLFSEVKNKKFTLEEFIEYPGRPLITRDGVGSRNEIVLGFYVKL